jgi:hypothetical protein
VLDCVNHTAQGYNQIANYTFEKISLNNDGDAVAITDEASGNRLFFRSHINNTWVERTALSDIPLMVAGEPIMCKIVNNGFVYVAINYVDSGYDRTKFLRSYDYGLSWDFVYQNGIQCCNAVDVGDDGIAVAMLDNGTAVYQPWVADDTTNTWQPFGGVLYTLRSVGGVSVNNNGKFFFSGIRNNQASTVISFLCDIASETSITFSDAEIPFISNPRINDAYSVLGSIAGGRTRFITSDNKVFITSDNKTFVVSSGGGIGGLYMCDYLSSTGEVPDSSNIHYGSFNASDIGKLYICGDINANIAFVNWQNNVTPISADNMLSLSESVEKLQLYVGDFVISAIDNLEATESHLLKCAGQTVSNTDYPLLYPLLTSYYGTNRLPDFENDGIQGLHLYIKAS